MPEQKYVASETFQQSAIKVITGCTCVFEPLILSYYELEFKFSSLFTVIQIRVYKFLKYNVIHFFVAGRKRQKH